MSKTAQFIIGLLLVLGVIGGLLEWGYRHGWNAHSAKVNADYNAKVAKSQAKQAKVTQKVAQAEQVGSAENDVIIREVTKYVSTPGRTKCDFDDNRVRIKQRAVTNANNIPGFDD